VKKIDLNVDIGEGFPYDESLLEFATSANVCCGAHAGSPDLTIETVALCQRKGVRIGMHPGYPDRESMGRQPGPFREAMLSLRSQITSFPAGVASYVKPHGALYNLSAYAHERLVATSKAAGSSYRPPLEPEAAKLVEQLFTYAATPRRLMGLPQSGHELLANRADVELIREGFADRAYLPSGKLVPRSEEGAMLQDPMEIRAQVLLLAPEIDSLCLHGDTPGCLEFAEMVTRTLVDAGYEVGV
jgi:UPF0271 protein